MAKLQKYMVDNVTRTKIDLKTFDQQQEEKEAADLKAKHKREVDQEKKDIERTRQQTNENVRLSRPAKGQRTLTIDFSKAPNPKKAKDKNICIPIGEGENCW